MVEKIQNLSENMLELNHKYVLHIPLYKFKDEKLILIEIDEIIDDLILQLNENGYDSFYTQKVKSHYKSRSFDELIITIFTSYSHKQVETIFSEWFEKNNNILEQESFAYEHNNSLFIKKIKEKSDDYN